MLYKLISKLLDYPDAVLLDALPELADHLAHAHGLALADRQVLAGLLEYLADTDRTELQAAYVQTFDLTPEHALYLTHHLFGDDKNRGPALIDLTEFYKEFGLELRTGEGISNELPDYLPLILEFAAELGPDEAHMFLSQWTKVIKQLADNLAKAGSPYAPVVRLIEQHSQLVKAAA